MSVPAAIMAALDALPHPAMREAGFAALRASWDEESAAWAAEVWPRLEALMTEKDNHLRAIGGQAVAALARQVPADRERATLPGLILLTFDARFVTARHVIQRLWKLGLHPDPAFRREVRMAMSQLWRDAAGEKNAPWYARSAGGSAPALRSIGRGGGQRPRPRIDPA